MAELRGGTSCEGFIVVTKKEVPMIFRINGSYLEYSLDNGVSWTQV